ncbi:MAG: ATP-binding protein [Melioribacteraceae bacterium]|nr:ATP-binding protein [Melioribacteraceae bacterium]
MRIENQNIEYKSIWKDEYFKWVCGFANANGGSIFIGVNNNF